ncbi:MAG: glutathione S-transferase family protein [Myxococcota bacterium]
MVLFVANKNYSSWSLRPWVLMRELAIPFEERLVPFGSNFRAFSPSGLVPCLHDGPIRVWDSLAIALYLGERHPGVWPTDPVARAWATSAAAEMHSGFTALRSRCSMNCGIRATIDPGPVRADLDRLSELWSASLDQFGGPFLAGPTFGAVDAFFAPVAFRIQTYGLQLDPASLAYAARLRALPSMSQWYRDALAETERDERHDAESRAVSNWTEDLRA